VKVYCVVRADTPQHGMERLEEMFYKNGFLLSPAMRSKIEIAEFDFRSARISLFHEARMELINTLTCVIHCAWPINFNLGVLSFEGQIRALRGLLQLCLQVRTFSPARLYFVSTIAVAHAAPGAIPELIAQNFDQSVQNGYGLSKFVAENIVYNAAIQTGMEARVIRFSQLIGDNRVARWNETEYVPLMIRGSLLLGTLPDLSQQYITWMPVDIAAECLLEVAGFREQRQVGTLPLSSTFSKDVAFQIVPPRVVKWEDVYPILRRVGFRFDLVSQEKWVEALRNSDPNPYRNPTIKLVDFFNYKFSAFTGEVPGPTFDKTKTRSLSISLDTYTKFTDSNLMQRIAELWYEHWTAKKGDQH
jgi:thioester reductase-like protein